MFKRKILLINKPFQLRFIGWMMGVALAPVTVFFAAHHYFFSELKKLGHEIALPPDHIYFRFIDGQSHKLFLVFLLCSLIAVAVVFILGLILSHQIAGPIHNLKQYMMKQTEGQPDLPKLKFRKNDYFLEIPEIVNAFVDSQKKKKD